MTFAITSPTFDDQGEIPIRYTCEGEDVSPPLEWTDPPVGTESFVLIIDDPDAPDPAAPRMIWVHWVLYNLPAAARQLPEAVTRNGLPPGTCEGTNNWNRPGYGGPCPPIGRHRYFHKLHALDTVLPALRDPTKAAIEKAMAGHILGKAEIVGTYRKQKA
jgi:Raf kinase inhibitor-like YbhB/YbcL family protein